VRQYQARDNQANAEDREREHVGDPFPGPEQTDQPGRENQPGDGGDEQRDAADHGPPSARRARVPGDVPAGDDADQDHQVRDDADDAAVVVTGAVVAGRRVLGLGRHDRLPRLAACGRPTLLAAR
jgi:hypothetical protein